MTNLNQYVGVRPLPQPTGLDPVAGITVLLLLALVSAQATANFDYKGHIKYQSLVTNYPSDSLF
ncbi:MAG: hypothetical protein V3R76_09095, partial [Gammaproteobacteria bacterium]